MINYKHIQQGSIEWLQLKWGKIGGTLAGGLFVNSDTLLIDILSQRCEEFEPTDNYESDAMERGSDLEPYAREYLNLYTGLEFKETGWLQSEENELLGISPDGLTEDEKISCELKCLGRKAHYAILLKQETPKDKLDQCLHYFTVNPKLEKHYFMSFRPESPKPFIELFTLDTVIDLGQKRKVEVKQYGVKGQEIKPKIETVSDIKTIREWRKIALGKADKLLEDIKEKEKLIKF